MKVYVDGVEVEVKGDVRIEYDAGDNETTLLVIANHEGLVYDVLDEEGEVYATSYDFVSHLMDRIHGRGA